MRQLFFYSSYTEQKENIRLISARLATKTERSIYYDTDSYFG